MSPKLRKIRAYYCTTFQWSVHVSSHVSTYIVIL